VIYSGVIIALYLGELHYGKEKESVVNVQEKAKVKTAKITYEQIIYYLLIIDAPCLYVVYWWLSKLHHKYVVFHQIASIDDGFCQF